MPSEPIDPVFFPTPADFRAWLGEHYADSDMLWVGYYKKASGRLSVTWEETVDEALCYGWIDGIRRSLGEEAYVIRFTPRKPRSVWSGRNIERVEVLRSEGRMTKAGLNAYTQKDVHEHSGYVVGDRPEELPKAMRADFKKNAKAWTFYQAQPPGYQKQTMFWVSSAKREETRQRRLATLIEDSANGLRIRQLRRRQG